MIIKKFENEADWLSARVGVITGTKLQGVLPKERGVGYRTGFYELIAERVAIPPSQENAMDRGIRLEEIAIEEFEKAIGKKVERGMVVWFRDDEENIAVSPDGWIGEKEAIEVKCLSSAKHIEAWLTKKLPSEYEAQVIQYFIVNEKLERLYFTFFDPRMPKSLFWIEVNREEVKDKVSEYFQLEKEALKKIAEIETELTF